jgi:hypothetical protein
LLSVVATDVQPPTYQSIQTLQLELNENAASVHSTRGGGLHGHLALTIAPAVYVAHANVAFIEPVAPANPIFPAGATQAQIAEGTRQHQKNIRIFSQYHDTDKALCRMLTEACPATYLEALRDPIYGYGATTTLEQPAKFTYAMVTPNANQIII